MAKPVNVSFRFLYVIVIFLVLFLDDMFYSTFIKDTDNPLTKPVMVLYTLLSFFLIQEMSPVMRNWFIVVAIWLFLHTLESYHDYHNPLQYPHVFSIIFCLFLMFFVYAFYKKFGDKINLLLISSIIVVFWLLSSIFVYSHTFTLSAFLGNDRGHHSPSVYMLLVPCFYFFNRYFSNKNFWNFLVFLLVFGYICFSQQRTVWAMLASVFILNLIFMKRSNFRIDVGALIPIFIMFAIVFMFVSSFIVTNEEIMERLGDSVKDFSKSDDDKEGGTAAWRRRQREAYQPFIDENFLIGMRLKGFELPLQFHDGGTETWGPMTGHHFHSFYVDKLFYFGYVGLILYLAPMVLHFLILVFKTRKFLSLEQVTMVSFLFTYLFYGYSYDWSVAMYGLLGYGIAILEKDPEAHLYSATVLPS